MQDPLAGWPAGPGLSELDFLEDAAGPLLPLGPDDAMLGSASGAQQLQGWDAPPPLAATSSGPSGSGSGGRPQTAEEKLELARAKNREKQARFRARQKERKQHLAEQYEQTAADLERERERHEEQRLKGALLEAVKQQKDTAIEILTAAGGGEGQQGGAAPQQQQQQQQQQAAARANGRLVTASGGGGGDSSSGDSSGTVLSTRDILGLTFRERVDICCSLFKGNKPAKRTLIEHAGPRADGFALELEVKQELGKQMVAQHPQVLDAALAMTPEMVLKEWADFGDFTAEVLAEVDSGRLGEADAEHELAPAVVYQAILNAILMMHKPECQRRLVTHSTLPGESEEQAAQRWRQVALAMAPSREQGLAILPYYREYRSQCTQLATESALSLAALQEIQQSLSQQLLELDTSLSASAMQYLRLFEAAGQLSQQPDAALMLLVKFYGLAGKCVTPLQKARMIAACRPLHPDVPAIVHSALEYYELLTDDLKQPPVAAAHMLQAQPQQQEQQVPAAAR